MHALSAAEFMRLRDLLSTYCGVFLDTSRHRVLEQAVARRLGVVGGSFASYERRVLVDRDELRRLAELVLNHETYFFRNQPHMRALQDVLLPELHRRKPAGEPIRIWSAGCASGEEAYSLAITALEVLPHPARPIQIWGTDLSEAALESAREGYYSGRSLSNVSPKLLARYFEPRDHGFVVNERVRSLVRFERVNLLEPLPPSARGVDIIFCQNVIIYFQMATSRMILGQFHEMLPEGGMLFLGFSETLWNIFDAFHTREVQGAYVYYKETLKPKRQTGFLAGTAAVPRRAPTQPLTPPEAARRLEMRLPVPEAKQDVADADILQHGAALLAEGRTAEAMESLRRIAPQSQLAAQAITLIARAHADRGELDLALVEARRVAEIAPLNDDAALLLGILYMRQGMWDAALAQLERARYLNAIAPLISFHLGEVYRQLKRADLAIREYRNTLKKLATYPPDTVVDGVAVGWLRETCQRHMRQLSQHTGEH